MEVSHHFAFIIHFVDMSGDVALIKVISGFKSRENSQIDLKFQVFGGG